LHGIANRKDVEIEHKNTEIREILNMQSCQKREYSASQNKLEAQINSFMAENARITREYTEIKESNTILLQIKESHETLTATLKETELKL